MTIYRRSSPVGSPATVNDFLPSGTVVGAAFVLYGPRTIFVFSAGDGVHVTQLDPESKEWVLLHEQLDFPDNDTLLT